MPRARAALVVFSCPSCGGRGWERAAHRELDAFPDPCGSCGGLPFMSIGELAKRLDGKNADWSRCLESALRRVHKGLNVRASTGMRILELLDARGMLPRAPTKQLELAR